TRQEAIYAYAAEHRHLHGSSPGPRRSQLLSIATRRPLGCGSASLRGTTSGSRQPVGAPAMYEAMRQPVAQSASCFSAARTLTSWTMPARKSVLLGHVSSGLHCPIQLAVGTVIQSGFLIGPDLYYGGRSDRGAQSRQSIHTTDHC